MDAVRVREREDPHEGVEEATAHTSLNLEEKYRAGNCVVSKDRKRFTHGMKKRGMSPFTGAKQRAMLKIS